MALIHEKIAAIMADLEPIGKKQKNQQQGFNFRGIDDVMNALYPILTKHSVFVAPEVLNVETTDRQTKSGGTMTSTVAQVKYTFYAADGSSVSAITLGEGRDSGDKSSPKAMAIAFKYALFQVFCIPTEEMRQSDPDRYTPEESVKLEPRKPEQVPPCAKCGSAIVDVTMNGRVIKAASTARITLEKYGMPLCAECAVKAKENREVAI